MSWSPSTSSVPGPDEAADLFDLDTDDLVTEIMDQHPHLLDQQDDMEQLAPYKSALPSAPAPVIHAGPAAAKRGIHTPSARRGQHANPSPPARQDFAPHQDAQTVPADRHTVPSKALKVHRDTASYKSTTPHKCTSHEKVDPYKEATGHQSRQRYTSQRSSALRDRGLSRQRSEQGTQKHTDELSQKISDLSLRDQKHSQQAIGGRARRHRSSFVDVSQPVQLAEQIHGRSCRHGPSPYADLTDVRPISGKDQQYTEPAMALDADAHVDQSSSREWEDEDDEEEYEQVSVNQTKRACNGNEPEISTDQDLKYTSLVWAESSAKMLYLCGRKMYEVMWTSQTSQKLRKSAMHTTKSASGQAADGLGRLVRDTCRAPLGGVKHYVSHRYTALKAARFSPREAARWSMIRAMRLSRMRMAEVAAPVLELLIEAPESGIENNWDLCDDGEDDFSNGHDSSSYDYGDEAGDALGLFEDDGDY